MLTWIASARAQLATAPSGSLAGARVAVLAGVAVAGGGSLWRVRGMSWARLGGDWLRAMAFVDAVRGMGAGPPAAVRLPADLVRLEAGGRLLGRPGAAGELLCGLCGGWIGAPVDAVLASHPLAPSHATLGAV